ncbi:hypothetical protein GGR03_004670 [Aurantimonas endophytica]|uniref:Uncharacterized protein n=1 Tax=Aurantimonas endophytica TaxID=1522175 RepID=A0A7W6MS17_9HYPH|nr:hypothetical protein [Aurantimonas endophytica]
MQPFIATALAVGLISTQAKGDEGCEAIAASEYHDRVNDAFADLQTRTRPSDKATFSRFEEMASYQPQIPGWLVPFYATSADGSQIRWFGLYM